MQVWRVYLCLTTGLKDDAEHAMYQAHHINVLDAHRPCKSHSSEISCLRKLTLWSYCCAAHQSADWERHQAHCTSGNQQQLPELSYIPGSGFKIIQCSIYMGSPTMGNIGWDSRQFDFLVSPGDFVSKRSQL